MRGRNWDPKSKSNFVVRKQLEIVSGILEPVQNVEKVKNVEKIPT
jgi:hypothetical protein